MHLLEFLRENKQTKQLKQTNKQTNKITHLSKMQKHPDCFQLKSAGIPGEIKTERRRNSNAEVSNLAISLKACYSVCVLVGCDLSF